MDIHGEGETGARACLGLEKRRWEGKEGGEGGRKEKERDRGPTVETDPFLVLCSIFYPLNSCI